MLVLRKSNQMKENFGEVLISNVIKTLLQHTEFKFRCCPSFLGDKYLYWYQEDGQDKVVFQFAIENNKCVVMSDPLAHSGYLEKGLSQFLAEAEDSKYLCYFSMKLIKKQPFTS